VNAFGVKQLVCGLVSAGALLALTADARGQARTVRMDTPLGERAFAILLPVSYQNSAARYPVVYLFHGGGQDHTAFMARKAFPVMARRHEFIVVMPAAGRSYGGSGPQIQERYYDFVAGEIVDYVDSHYRTIPSKGSRAIAGLSMGGRIATMTALRHPDRFGTVGAFSAALRPDVEATVRESPASSPYFYVSCGTEDPLLSINREFVGWLVERDFDHEYREAPGMGHTWSLWDEQIGVFFDLLETRGLRPQSPGIPPVP